jgi:hypothetical protein
MGLKKNLKSHPNINTNPENSMTTPKTCKGFPNLVYGKD